MQSTRLIYVLEDDTDIRLVIKLTLEKAGFQVLDFGLALDFYLTIITQSPDLFILDVTLPDGNGLAITREVSKYSRYPIPVIIISADAENRTRAMEAGATTFVAKPFDVTALLAEVEKVLRPIKS